MTRQKIVFILSAAAVALLAQPAFAHGASEVYAIPVPANYVYGAAAAAVIASFVIVGVFLKGTPGASSYWRHNLLRHRSLRALLTFDFTRAPLLSWLLYLVSPVFLLKLLAVFLGGLVLATGFWGEQIIYERNFAPIFVWVIFWVGMGFVAALLGNFWAMLNPWKIFFEWAEWLYTRFKPGGSLSLNLPYPSYLGIWPAVILFFAFAWAENAYPQDQSELPDKIGMMVAVYSGITLAAMFLFGKHRWLRNGELFSVVFGLLARFSPTEVRVRDPELCRVCSNESCLDDDGQCVDCYECFERSLSSRRSGVQAVEAATLTATAPATATRTAGEWNIRPFAIGLARHEIVTPSVFAVVLLLLAMVTFDGFSYTPAWREVWIFFQDNVSGLQGRDVLNPRTIADTLGLLLFPATLLVVYLVFAYMMSRLVNGRVGTLAMAKAFVFSLVPIALAYQIAHFTFLLLIFGQRVIPIISDPFGQGWSYPLFGEDIFGTGDYGAPRQFITETPLWILSVTVIIVGHVIAVYLAHHISMRMFKDRMLAIKSQYPMLVLMVLYTCVSLWIITQDVQN